MAIIPDYEQRRDVLPTSPAIADVQPGRFGKDGEAMMGLGGEVANLGAELIRVRKNAEDNDSAANAYMDVSEWWTTEVQSRQKQLGELNNDGTYRTARGYSDDLDNEAKKVINEKMKALPSGNAQRILAQKTDSLLVQGYTNNSVYESRILAENFLKNASQRNNKRVLQVGKTPEDLNIVMRDMADEYRAGVGVHFSAGQARDLFKENGKDAIFSYFYGLSQTPSGIQRGLGELESLRLKPGEPGAAPKDDNLLAPSRYVMGSGLDVNESAGWMSDFLDQNDYKRIREELLANKGAQDSTMIKSAARTVDDTIAAMQRGNFVNEKDPNNSATVGSLEFLRSKINNGISQDDFNRKFFEYEYSAIFNDATNRMAALPLGSKQDLMKAMESAAQDRINYLGLDPKLGNTYMARVREDLNKNADVLWKKMQTAATSDPANFVARHRVGGRDFGLQFTDSRSNGGMSLDANMNSEYFADTIAAQRAKQIPEANIRLLKNQQAKDLAGKFKSADPQVAGSLMAAYQEAWGENADRNFKQLTEHGLPKEYLGALNASIGGTNPAFVQSFVDNIRNPQAADGLLAQSGKSDVGKDIDKSVGDATNKYFNSIIAGGTTSMNQELVRGLNINVAAEAKKLVATGVEKNEAMKRAVSDLVGNSYYSIGGALVPKRIGSMLIDKAPALEAEMQYKQQADFIAANSEISKEWADQVAKGRVRWQTNKDLTALKLQVIVNGKAWDIPDKRTKSPIIIDIKEVGGKAQNSDGALKYLKR